MSRALSLLTVLLLAGCPSRADEAATLSVFAASSLAAPFAELEAAFEGANPGLDLRGSFAGSQVLRLQIEQGAPADLFLSADPDQLQALVEAGLAAAPLPFASNELVVITPAAAPLPSFAALPSARRIVLGTEQAPVGRYARRLLADADERVRPGFSRDVLDRVVSFESNVGLVRAKVELGEADAAIVYRSDALGSTRLASVPLPDGLSVRATYPAALLLDSPRREAAERFLRFLTSGEAQRILAAHGFGAP